MSYYNIAHKHLLVKDFFQGPGPQYWSTMSHVHHTTIRATSSMTLVQCYAVHVHLTGHPCHHTLGWIPVTHSAPHSLQRGHVEVGCSAAIVEGDSPILSFNHAIIYHRYGVLSSGFFTFFWAPGPEPRRYKKTPYNYYYASLLDAPD